MDMNMDSKLTRRDRLENVVNAGSPSLKSCPLTTPEMQTAGASMESLTSASASPFIRGESGQHNLEDMLSLRSKALERF